MVSDERGNSFEVESRTTLSPLTAQFLKMCEMIGVAPPDVLTGTSNPFRTESERDLTFEQRSVGTKLARQYWRERLDMGRLQLLIVSSDSARDLIVSLASAQLTDEFLSGWGPTKSRQYAFGTEGPIVHLPQFSRYKLFSREACHSPLRRAFGL